MPSMRNPANQAHWAVEKMRAHNEKREQTRQEPGKVSSLGTTRSYEQGLKNLASHLRESREGDLRSVNREQVENFLRERAGEVGQKQLDQERQAAQAWLSCRDGENVKFPRSEHKTQLDESRNLAQQSRVYEPQQLDRIQDRLTEQNSLALQVMRETGIRAHEVGTLGRHDEQPANEREWRNDRFVGKDGVTYTVKGKGGLTREIKLSQETAQKLEQARKSEPDTVKDRGINYQSRYNIGTGQALSQAFTRASVKEVGWCAGMHSIRHVYAQGRMDKLQERGYTYQEAKEVVSQEVGHFRPETTEAYLR